ncbi:MAG: AAA family ATPase [Chloroflexota bacterium]
MAFLEKEGRTSARAVSAAGCKVQVYTLGQFRLVSDGQPINASAWRRKKARQVFKYLLSRPHRRALKETVVDLFWPDSDPTAASTNLRSTIHAIRQVIDLGNAEDVVVADADSIGLYEGDELWIDADAFDDLLTRARNADDPVDALVRACGLYGGEYLPDDFYEDWTLERRDGLKRAWIDAELQLAQLLEARGHPDDAIEHAQRAVNADRSNERAAQTLMQLLLGQDRRGDALRVFGILEHTLREELGVAPTRQSRDLQRAAVDAATSRGLSHAPEFHCAYVFPQPRVLVGREAELARLNRVVDRVRQGGQVVLISGPAGAGKSALVGRAVMHAREQGMLCLAGGSYDERSAIPLAAFHGALTDYVLTARLIEVDDRPSPTAAHGQVVVELASQLGLRAATTGDPATSQMRLFGTVLSFVRAEAERRPVLLCVEDLHAADAGTLSLFHYLAQQLRRLSICLVGTYRSDEPIENSPLTRLLTSLARERIGEHIRLHSLDVAETRAMIGLLQDAPVDTRVSEAVFAASEGNPLFIEQLVAAFTETSPVHNPLQDAFGRSTTGSDAPHVVRDVIGERLGRLSQRLRHTLEYAAVLGRTFEYSTLFDLVDAQDESDLLADLDAAITANIISETATGFAFGHALLRDAVYWSLSGPKRQLLHGRAGEILEMRLTPADQSRQTAELAHHFGLASGSPKMRERALTYSLAAARAAAELSFDYDAHRHFSDACALLSENSRLASTDITIEALEGRGIAERHLGLWTECRQTFRQILTISTSAVHRALAHEAIAVADDHLSDTSAALAEVQAGLRELESCGDVDTTGSYVQLQYVKALLQYLPGHYAAVRATGTEMLERAESLARPDLLQLTYCVIGWGYMGAGRHTQALEYYTRAMESAQQTSVRIGVAVDHENMGMVYLDAADFVAARFHLNQAITLFRDLAREARAMNSMLLLGGVCLDEGDVAQARSLGELAASFASESQDRWEADCHELLGRICYMQADWDNAIQHFDTALAIHTRVSYMQGAVKSLIGLGRVEWESGDANRARSYLVRAADVVEAADVCPETIAAHAHLGRLLRLLGNSEASAHIERALSAARDVPETSRVGVALLAAAELQADHGNYSAASDLSQRALASRLPIGLCAEVHALAAAATCHLPGHEADALTHAAEAISLAERLNAPVLLSAGHRARAESLAASDTESANAAFQTALRYAEDARSPYARGRVLTSWSKALSGVTAYATRARELFAEAEATLTEAGFVSQTLALNPYGGGY